MGEWIPEPGAEQFDIRSSSGSTPWRSASCHQSSISSASFSGCVSREIVALGEVVGEVVQLPLLGVEVVTLGVLADGLPPPPSCSATSARLPAISKYCSVLVAGAPASSSTDGERVPGHRKLLDTVDTTSGGVTPSRS